MMQIRGPWATFAVVALSAATGAAAVVACAQGTTGAQPAQGDASTQDSSTTPHDGGSGSSSGSSGSSGGGSGCDANTQTDYNNCGSCGHVCPNSEICNVGQCQASCVLPQVECPGQAGCFDLTSSIQNCGTCGKTCPAPTGTVTAVAECTSSTCGFTCPTPTDAGVAADAEAGAPITKCAGDSGTPGCFDLTSSTENCGSCGTSCEAGDTCTSGSCCPTGSIMCGGTCTNVQTSATNCGACNAPCATTCAAGVCAVGYATTNPTLPFINACALPGEKAVLGDQETWTGTPALPLPFTFTLFGVAQTEVWLQNEGTIGFGAPQPAINDGFPDCQFFDANNVYAAAVAFGDGSLVTGNDGVCYATLGSPDAGVADGGAGAQFVVTWSNANEIHDTGSVLTFSIVLTQGTNTIDFMYQTIETADGGTDAIVLGANATVGIKAQGQGTAYDTYSCATTFIPATITTTPFNIRFTPSP